MARSGKIWQDLARCGKMEQGEPGKIWQDGTKRIQPSSKAISKVTIRYVKGSVDYIDCVYSDPTTNRSAASILPLCTVTPLQAVLLPLSYPYVQ